VHAVSLPLHHKLAGQMDVLQAMLRTARAPAGASTANSSVVSAIGPKARARPAAGRAAGACRRAPRRPLRSGRRGAPSPRHPLRRPAPSHPSPTAPRAQSGRGGRSSETAGLSSEGAAFARGNDTSGSSSPDASGELVDPSSLDDEVPPMPSNGAGASAPSGRLSSVSSRRLCTEAMLKVLQQEIRKGKRRSVELSFVGDQLAIMEPIGRGGARAAACALAPLPLRPPRPCFRPRGPRPAPALSDETSRCAAPRFSSPPKTGFGRVFRGAWHKRPAAIKVMNARSTDSEAVSDAMEMAVLSTVNHPNIVQVYCCLTDMVEVRGPGGADAAHSSAPALPALGAHGGGGGGYGAASVAPRVPRYRRMLPGEDEEAAGPTYNVVVMEYMDRLVLGGWGWGG
jgi:hypothetical protein